MISALPATRLGLPVCLPCLQVRRMEQAYRVYSPGYIQRCLKRKVMGASEDSDANTTTATAASRRFIPASWEADEHFQWFKNQGVKHSSCSDGAGAGDKEEEEEGLEESDVEQSMLLMKFHKLSSDVASLLCNVPQHVRVEFLFELNEEEKRILAHAL